MTDSFGRFCEFFLQGGYGPARGQQPLRGAPLRYAPSDASHSIVPLIASAIRKSPKGADHDYNR